MKKLIWLGSSYKTLKEFPDPIRQAMGHALFYAQNGKMHIHQKYLVEWVVLGSRRFEKMIEVALIESSTRWKLKNTCSCCTYFKKKSKSGISTPKQELEVLKSRLKEARALYKDLTGEGT